MPMSADCDPDVVLGPTTTKFHVPWRPSMPRHGQDLMDAIWPLRSATG